MSLTLGFFLYAAVFRLAIIAAGVFSIALGYRLYAGGSTAGSASKSDATFNAKLAGQEFALKNAAPGAFFALFGVIIICIMLAQGNPELTLKSSAGAHGDSAAPPSTDLTLRGSPTAATSEFDDAVRRGRDFDRKQDTVNAIANYEDAMTVLARPMNDLAWDDLQQGKAEDALPLARLAVQLCPATAPFLDTLAEILFKQGQRDEARKWMDKAASLDPKYRNRWTELQQAAK